MFLVLALASVPFAYDGTLSPGQTLRIRDINGSVRVRTGDRLAIRATKHAERGDPNAVAIHVENRSDGIVVCVRYPPNAGRGCEEHTWTEDGHEENNTVVDFDVTVPRGIVLEAATINGSIDAINEGPTSAKAVNGTVRVEGREVHNVGSVNGAVVVKIIDRARGTLDAKTVNGSIDVSLPPGSGFELSARTVSGNITAPGVTVEYARYGPGARASGTVGDGAFHVNAKTVSGSITVRR
jgi:hypothetical protein